MLEHRPSDALIKLEGAVRNWSFNGVTELNGFDPGLTRETKIRELLAYDRGELRTRSQLEFFHQLIDEADAEQRALIASTGLDRLVHPRPLLQIPELVIQVAEDLSWIRYGVIPVGSVHPSPEDLNPHDQSGLLFNLDGKIKWLARIEDPKLITPYPTTLVQLYQQGEISMETINTITSLQHLRRRITLFGAMPLTWDESIDGKAWAFNIDTAHACHSFREAGLFNDEVVNSAEFGTGMGGQSAYLLKLCRNLKSHIVTDINPDAIAGARRNLLPLLGERTLDYQLGKGVRGMIGKNLDLALCNPPYLSRPGETAEDQVKHRDDSHRYGGTGLIWELLQYAPYILNPDNPDAAIGLQCSNLTQPDIDFYMSKLDGKGPKITLTQIGGPKLVPLQIWELLQDEKWIDHLMKYKLVDSPELAQKTGFRYWHELIAYKIQVDR